MNDEWVVFDTNIWIFGLRRQHDCYQLLQGLHTLYVKTPFQIFLELQANLSPEELKRFFRLVHLNPNHVELLWEKATLKTIQKYRGLGCKLGDAAIAAHMEMTGSKTLVSENRDFFEEIQGLPFRVLRAKEALQEFNLG